MREMKSIDTQKLVMLASLTAIVLVLQLLSSFIPIYPFRLNLVIVPIVIGAALISPLAGLWLGLVFGFVVLVSSSDVIPFMVFSPFATIFVILLRGAISGLAAGFTYNALEKSNKTVAVLCAAFVCATTNTGLFVAGVYIFFLPLLAEWGVSGASEIASFVFIGMIGINFLIEMAVNLILCPAIVRLVQYRRSIKAEA